MGKEIRGWRSRQGIPRRAEGLSGPWPSHLAITTPLTQLFMGCEPKTRLLCPLEGPGLWPGREEGWHGAASGFLLPSPFSFVLKEEGEGLNVSHRETKRSDSVFISSSLEGHGRLQESGRELHKAELTGQRDWDFRDLRQGCQQRSTGTVPHRACGWSLGV